jgi:hypothetical protein
MRSTVSNTILTPLVARIRFFFGLDLEEMRFSDGEEYNV